MLEEREARGAVAAARAHVQRHLGLLARGGLDEQRAAGLEDLGQVLDHGVLQGRKALVGRVDQHEIVPGAGPRIGAESGQRVLAEHDCVVEAELVDYEGPLADEVDRFFGDRELAA